MIDTVVTHLQIFAIGFSFAVAGPCLLVCTPILITYIAGRRSKVVESLFDVAVFLFGRLTAYVMLGAMAGLSGSYLRNIIQADLSGYLNIASGLISIALGLAMLRHVDQHQCDEGSIDRGICDRGGVFALGFFIGVSPCAPLAGLLFEIALMSKGAIEGASYALSFALGTFLAGFVIIGALSGLIKGAARRLVKSDSATRIFRIACAILLAVFGIGIIGRVIVSQ